jgi:glycosyltransferase involved in cell wall biosynthesis
MHVRKQGNQKYYYSTLRLLSIALQATWALIQCARLIPADIIHICKPQPMNSIAGLVLHYLHAKQIFLDCDDYEAASNRFGSRWQRWGVAGFERWMPRHVYKVTTNTYFMRNKLITWGVQPERVIYLPNGIERTRFTPSAPDQLEELRKQLKINDKKVIGFIGSMSLPSHPIDLLLVAFQQILQSYPETVLLLVGGGEDYERLQQQAFDMGVFPNVRFCGRIPPQDVMQYYQLCDVSVDPVLDNDAARGRSPLKLFESWATGVPFISADVGDRKMLAGEPPAAVLTRPGDSTALCDAILELIANPEKRESLRLRGFEQVNPYYWENIAPKMVQVYQNHFHD